MIERYILDKTGRKILPGDILKVYHFTGARRKRFYMYKQVIEETVKGNSAYYKVGHLVTYHSDEYFLLLLDNKKIEDIEIVQGYFGGTSYEDRKRINNES